ncbi:MAG: peptidylprolyl isomerase [Oscillospiraceae bacterium]|nr:peptidylprolyl isomerase [Oscillospiraceae bacterium]
MKKTNRIKGLCLVLVLVLLLAACGNGGGGGDAPEPSGDLLAGIDAYAVIMEIEGGRPVLWEEFFFDLHNCRTILETHAIVADWDELFEGQDLYENVSYNEFAIRYAIDAALDRRAVEILFTQELGEVLEEEFYDEVRAFFKEHHGMDEEDFQEFLRESFLTEAVFRYINEVMTMHDLAMTLLYGPGGVDVSDEAVEALIEDYEVLRAKHILIDMRDLTEEEEAEGTAFAMSLYEELQTLSGDEMLERFEEMMAAYGEDPGMFGNPDGYTFQPGMMVEEFTAGTQALGLYEVGPPVRSFFGYHIILRLPPQRDATIMQPDGSQSRTIQVLAARVQFDRALEAIREGLEYQLTQLGLEIVPSEIFFDAHDS